MSTKTKSRAARTHGSSESTYDPSDYPRFAVTVDVVLFTIEEGVFKVLLIRRGEAPFKGAWALPGGFVQRDEDLDTAARRELAEEASIALEADSLDLEQLGSYGAPNRDPRMRVVTVAYWAILPSIASPRAGTDAAEARLFPVRDIDSKKLKLAFDHRKILEDARERARAKLEYTTIATRFCADEFTLSELREVYEAVWETELDPGNFQRKAWPRPKEDDAPKEHFVEPLGRRQPGESGGRPAQLFKAGKARRIQPPLLRPGH